MRRRIAVALFLLGSRLAAQSVRAADSNDVKSPDAIVLWDNASATKPISAKYKP